jgi:hypothetical protein
MCIYSRRLFKEWEQHGKIVIALDYDNTIKAYGFFGNDKDISKTINYVKKAQQIGAYVVIFTSRDQIHYNSILLYCKRRGIHVDSINKNPIDLPFGNNGSKIYYNINLCDRSGLTQSLKILKKTMKKYENHKKNLKNGN